MSDGCFGSCSALTSITIPSSVTSLGERCFYGCSGLETVSFKGKVSKNTSQSEIPTITIIKVPTEYLQDYKDAIGYSYKYIYAWNPDGSGDDIKPVTPCATPSISYASGELKFASETAGAEYHYTITDADKASDAYARMARLLFLQPTRFLFMQQLMAIQHLIRRRLCCIGLMLTWRMVPTLIR